MKKGQSKLIVFILALLIIIFVVALVWQFSRPSFKSSKSITGNVINEIQKKPEKVYAVSSDFDIQLRWKDFSSSYDSDSEKTCHNGYDGGNVWVDIYITNREVTEPYSCESIKEYEGNQNLREAIWDIRLKNGLHTDGYLITNMAELKKSQSFRFCCESYDGVSKFCKTAILEPYC